MLRNLYAARRLPRRVQGSVRTQVRSVRAKKGRPSQRRETETKNPRANDASLLSRGAAEQAGEQ